MHARGWKINPLEIQGVETQLSWKYFTSQWQGEKWRHFARKAFGLDFKEWMGILQLGLDKGDHFKWREKGGETWKLESGAIQKLNWKWRIVTEKAV